MIDKIAKLLALAENAGSPEEAETAFAKAQALASAHSIDLELARIKAGPTKREKPIQRNTRIGEVGKHVNGPLADLFVAIGNSNDVRTLTAQDNTFVVAHGLPSDIDQTEAMWASLAPLMVKFGNAHVKDKNAPWRSETATVWDSKEWEYVTKPVSGQGARRSFYSGFISRIGARLKEARAAQIVEADNRHFSDVTDNHNVAEVEGGSDNLPTGTAMVLKEKAAEIEQFMHDEYQRKYGTRRIASRRGGSKATSSGSSRKAGSQAANGARLSAQRGIGG